jgi:hypothetical protein
LYEKPVSVIIAHTTSIQPPVPAIDLSDHGSGGGDLIMSVI